MDLSESVLLTRTGADDAPRRGGWARRAGWLGWAAVVPLALWAVIRALGLPLGHPWPLLLAFTPYAGAATLLLLGMLLLARRLRAAAAAAIVLVVFLACLMPRGLGTPSDQYGPELTVMSMNTWGGRADAEQIVALVREHGVQVLAVQEFTPGIRAALARAGLDTLLPHQHLHPTADLGGCGLYSAQPLTEGEVLANPGGFLQAAAVLRLPGARAVRVVSVHTVPPIPADSVPWWVADLSAQPPADPAVPQILVGDFNATLDHREFRDLLDTGYVDAADALGLGFRPTWPFAGSREMLIPKITIDHVLAGPGIGVRDYKAITVSGTDHRALIATLVLPTGPAADSQGLGLAVPDWLI